MRGKVNKVLHEFKKGRLHSGKSGKLVKSRKQAIATALSEAGLSKRDRGFWHDVQDYQGMTHGNMKLIHNVVKGSGQKGGM